MIASNPTTSATPVPRPGMFATVRNRRGIIAAVEPFDGQDGRLHLVHIEYKDDQLPTDDRLLWEIEAGRTLLEPTALPNVSASDPMPGEDFDALVRAARWTALSPFLKPGDGEPLERPPIASPYHGAIQVEDFQLVPLLKALRMPRVNLMIADDVGLGKTIEAGLILTELFLRRRIQRVLILTPASLRVQWRDELRDKFSLGFDLVDRAETHALRRRLGMDANPWRAYSRIISSYHYLRQPDVLEQFLAACRTPEGSPHLPWDLLIVDECHNLMPSPFGGDSDLCTMLRQLTPQFEHRIFLSATPHNGHTRSFTGLLEILDPVRFSQKDEIKPAERERVQQVVLRRLKREINERTNPPRFCHRNPPHAVNLNFSPQEVALSKAFEEFRTAIRELIRTAEKRRQRTGSFAVEILGKRLLSCPVAFAESWRRSMEGLAEARAATDSEVEAARRDLERETGDDRESQSKESIAANVVGAWLKNVANELQAEIVAIDGAVASLGLNVKGVELTQQTPIADSRFDALVDLIGERLRSDQNWRDDERLVVFTEYKTTLDYLARRLRETYEPDRILTLFGGMDDTQRDLVKQAFNDPSEDVRVLVATDAAAEGLNLQQTARYLLHFDCPWNPSRLEQRNGRLDRHGQARDVTVFYFVSEHDQDLRFLAHLVQKANDIREDLGSANELFDEAAHRRLVQGESRSQVEFELDRRILSAKGRTEIEADRNVAATAQGQSANEQLRELARELDLDAQTLRDTLEAAMAIGVGRPQLTCSDQGICRVINTDLPSWRETIDDSMRIPTSRAVLGPVAAMAFKADPFMQQVGPRFVFRPRRDVLMMHLSHPMMQRALSTLSRRRYPGTGDEVSRWTVRLGDVPAQYEGLVLLTVEELAVNELREAFHHWVKTIAFPVRNGELGDPLPHRPAGEWLNTSPVPSDGDRERGRELFDDVEPDLKRFVRESASELTNRLQEVLKSAGETARREEDERYRSRQGEVSSLITENTVARLEREIARMKADVSQGLLFDEEHRLQEIERSIEEKVAEIERRRRHHEEVRKQLDHERERILTYLLPKRYTLSGEAQVFSISVEFRLPRGAA